jgi:uncharacterized protein DUF3558
MRLRATRCVAFGVVAMVAVAGCTSQTPGQAQPSAAVDTTTSGSPSSSDAPSRAPTVAHPLDPTKLINEPCSALTSADLAELNIVNPINGGTHHNAGGVQCTWSGDSGGGISIGWETVITDGLSDLYTKASTIAYWQPTTVAGYPAAWGDAISDGRAQGDCIISVGVNDHLYFDAQYTDPLNASQSCAFAQQGAADVIRNLGGS